MDIFNLEEDIKEYMDESNKQDLHFIVKEFKHGIFLNVLSRTKEYRKNHEMANGLAKILSVIDVACYTQTGENQKAANIIEAMYQQTDEHSLDDLILCGNLAYMCNFKLARRIMSDAVKRMEDRQGFDPIKAAHAYLILGEAEENLEKFARAIKYYKRGLTYFRKDNGQNNQTILFIHFKLGALHSLNNKTDEAINYLQKTIELAKEDNLEIKVNSLVSIAKMYGSQNDYEKAAVYLNEAFPLFTDSPLAGKLVHAEAYTEMAYNYFDQSNWDEAIPYYEKAAAIHRKLPQYSARELGMIYMQLAHCLEHKEVPEKLLAGINYEKAMEQLEKTNDWELTEGTLAEVIAFFDRIGNKRKKRFYENKFVKLTNQKANTR